MRRKRCYAASSNFIVMPLDGGLCARVADYANKRGFEFEGKRAKAIGRDYIGFELNGAGLSADKKKRLSK
ncbi:MAG: hypothetical protein ACLUKN_09550 [Bacilli bacterium]